MITYENTCDCSDQYPGAGYRYGTPPRRPDPDRVRDPRDGLRHRHARPRHPGPARAPGSYADHGRRDLGGRGRRPRQGGSKRRDRLGADAASCGNSPRTWSRRWTTARSPLPRWSTRARRRRVGRDGAGDPSPVDDPRALTILTTEHWSLLSARSLVYNEAFARAGMFLSFLAATLVALGLMATAMRICRGVPRHRRTRARPRPVHRPRDDGPRLHGDQRGHPPVAGDEPLASRLSRAPCPASMRTSSPATTMTSSASSPATARTCRAGPCARSSTASRPSSACWR